MYMKKIKRLLCIVNCMDTGGAETFLMKLYRKLNKEKYQMDFCILSKEKGFYEDEIIGLGGKVYHIPPKTGHLLKSLSGLVKVVRHGKYKYVLRIGSQSLVAIDLLFARFGGARRLALRSTNADLGASKVRKILHFVFGLLPKVVPTIKIAPSEKAAVFLFGKKSVARNKVFYLKNAIPISEFEFDEEIRNEIREELKLDQKFVVGHVGRFAPQKNHDFLIDIFQCIKERNRNAVLLLIGEGERKDMILEKVKVLKLEDSVRFLGIRNDVNKVLMAMDVFLFPSFYEGMPNTVIEAQTAGLSVYTSDAITREANITGQVRYLSLSESAQRWSDEVSSTKKIQRKESATKMRAAGYDIESITNEFEKLIFE